MARCSVTSKVFLGILTLIFWLAAAGLIFVGAWIYKEYAHYEQIAQALYTLVPATILIAIGAFLFLLGLIGCVGAFKEQRCLLGLYFTILLVNLCGLVFAGVFGYLHRFDVEDAVTDGLNDALEKYGTSNHSVLTDEVDFMQQQLKCCGSANASDWLSTPWHKTHLDQPYPDSCCMNNNCSSSTANSTALYDRGCYSYVKQEFLDHLGIVAGVCAGFAILQVCGMICSYVIFCRRRQDNPYIGLTSPEHLRV